MITVKQLAKILKELPDDMPVLVDGYEGDYDDLSGILISEFNLYAQRDDHMGSHLKQNRTKKRACGEHSHLCLLLSRCDSTTVYSNEEFSLIYGGVKAAEDWEEEE